MVHADEMRRSEHVKRDRKKPTERFRVASESARAELEEDGGGLRRGLVCLCCTASMGIWVVIETR